MNNRGLSIFVAATIFATSFFLSNLLPVYAVDNPGMMYGPQLPSPVTPTTPTIDLPPIKNPSPLVEQVNKTLTTDTKNIGTSANTSCKPGSTEGFNTSVKWPKTYPSGGKTLTSIYEKPCTYYKSSIKITGICTKYDTCKAITCSIFSGKVVACSPLTPAPEKPVIDLPPIKNQSPVIDQYGKSSGLTPSVNSYAQGGATIDTSVPFNLNNPSPVEQFGGGGLTPWTDSFAGGGNSIFDSAINSGYSNTIFNPAPIAGTPYPLTSTSLSPGMLGPTISYDLTPATLPVGGSIAKVDTTQEKPTTPIYNPNTFHPSDTTFLPSSSLAGDLGETPLKPQTSGPQSLWDTIKSDVSTAYDNTVKPAVDWTVTKIGEISTAVTGYPPVGTPCDPQNPACTTAPSPQPAPPGNASAPELFPKNGSPFSTNGQSLYDLTGSNGLTSETNVFASAGSRNLLPEEGGTPSAFDTNGIDLYKFSQISPSLLPSEGSVSNLIPGTSPAPPTAADGFKVADNAYLDYKAKIDAAGNAVTSADQVSKDANFQKFYNDVYSIHLTENPATGENTVNFGPLASDQPKLDQLKADADTAKAAYTDAKTTYDNYKAAHATNQVDENGNPRLDSQAAADKANAYGQTVTARAKTADTAAKNYSDFYNKSSKENFDMSQALGGQVASTHTDLVNAVNNYKNASYESQSPQQQSLISLGAQIEGSRDAASKEIAAIYEDMYSGKYGYWGGTAIAEGKVTDILSGLDAQNQRLGLAANFVQSGAPMSDVAAAGIALQPTDPQSIQAKQDLITQAANQQTLNNLDTSPPPRSMTLADSVNLTEAQRLAYTPAGAAAVEAAKAKGLSQIAQYEIVAADPRNISTVSSEVQQRLADQTTSWPDAAVGCLSGHGCQTLADISIDKTVNGLNSFTKNLSTYGGLPGTITGFVSTGFASSVIDQGALLFNGPTTLAQQAQASLQTDQQNFDSRLEAGAFTGVNALLLGGPVASSLGKFGKDIYAELGLPAERLAGGGLGVGGDLSTAFPDLTPRTMSPELFAPKVTGASTVATDLPLWATDINNSGLSWVDRTPASVVEASAPAFIQPTERATVDQLNALERQYNYGPNLTPVQEAQNIVIDARQEALLQNANLKELADGSVVNGNNMVIARTSGAPGLGAQSYEVVASGVPLEVAVKAVEPSIGSASAAIIPSGTNPSSVTFTTHGAGGRTYITFGPNIETQAAGVARSAEPLAINPVADANGVRQLVPADVSAPLPENAGLVADNSATRVPQLAQQQQANDMRTPTAEAAAPTYITPTESAAVKEFNALDKQANYGLDVTQTQVQENIAIQAQQRAVLAEAGLKESSGGLVNHEGKIVANLDTATADISLGGNNTYKAVASDVPLASVPAGSKFIPTPPANVAEIPTVAPVVKTAPTIPTTRSSSIIADEISATLAGATQFGKDLFRNLSGKNTANLIVSGLQLGGTGLPSVTQDMFRLLSPATQETAQVLSRAEIAAFAARGASFDAATASVIPQGAADYALNVATQSAIKQAALERAFPTANPFGTLGAGAAVEPYIPLSRVAPFASIGALSSAPTSLAAQPSTAPIGATNPVAEVTAPAVTVPGAGTTVNSPTTEVPVPITRPADVGTLAPAPIVQTGTVPAGSYVGSDGQFHKPGDSTGVIGNTNPGWWVNPNPRVIEANKALYSQGAYVGVDGYVHPIADHFSVSPIRDTGGYAPDQVGYSVFKLPDGSIDWSLRARNNTRSPFTANPPSVTQGPGSQLLVPAGHLDPVNMSRIADAQTNAERAMSSARSAVKDGNTQQTLSNINNTLDAVQKMTQAATAMGQKIGNDKLKNDAADLAVNAHVAQNDLANDMQAKGGIQDANPYIDRATAVLSDAEDLAAQALGNVGSVSPAPPPGTITPAGVTPPTAITTENVGGQKLNTTLPFAQKFGLVPVGVETAPSFFLPYDWTRGPQFPGAFGKPIGPVLTPSAEVLVPGATNPSPSTAVTGPAVTGPVAELAPVVAPVNKGFWANLADAIANPSEGFGISAEAKNRTWQSCQQNVSSCLAVQQGHLTYYDPSKGGINCNSNRDCTTTSNGDPFNPGDTTIASGLPKNTVVRVVSKDVAVFARVNDTGGFAQSRPWRIADLTTGLGRIFGIGSPKENLAGIQRGTVNPIALYADSATAQRVTEGLNKGLSLSQAEATAARSAPVTALAYAPQARQQIAQSKTVATVPKPTTVASAQPTTNVPTPPARPTDISTTPSAVASISRNLRSGDVGEDVRALQTYLNAKGFDLPVDGIYGPLTKQAVADWQKSNDMTIKVGDEGYFGPTSRAVISKEQSLPSTVPIATDIAGVQPPANGATLPEGVSPAIPSDFGSLAGITVPAENDTAVAGQPTTNTQPVTFLQSVNNAIKKALSPILNPIGNILIPSAGAAAFRPNPTSGQALADAVNAACKVTGCNAPLVQQALGGVASIESGFNSTVPHSGSQYQGFGQVGSAETQKAIAAIYGLSQSPKLTTKEQSQAHAIAVEAQQRVNQGSNWNPNTDSTLGPWLLVGNHLAVGSLTNVSAATNDPHIAAAALMGAQLAPVAYGSRFQPSAPLPFSATRAMQNNNYFVPDGSTLQGATQTILAMKNKQISDGANYAARFEPGAVPGTVQEVLPSPTSPQALEVNPASFQPAPAPVVDSAAPLRAFIVNQIQAAPLSQTNNPQQVVNQIVPSAPASFPVALPTQTNPLMTKPLSQMTLAERATVARYVHGEISKFWQNKFAQYGLVYVPPSLNVKGADTRLAHGQEGFQFANHPDILELNVTDAGLNINSISDPRDASNLEFMMAHETGHGVLRQLGILQPYLQNALANEKAADLLAGVGLTGLLRQGDPAKVFYTVVTHGDDYIKVTSGTPNPLSYESGVHAGTAAQRAGAVDNGMRTLGDLDKAFTQLGQKSAWDNTVATRGIKPLGVPAPTALEVNPASFQPAPVVDTNVELRNNIDTSLKALDNAKTAVSNALAQADTYNKAGQHVPALRSVRSALQATQSLAKVVTDIANATGDTQLGRDATTLARQTGTQAARITDARLSHPGFLDINLSDFSDLGTIIGEPGKPGLVSDGQNLIAKAQGSAQAKLATIQPPAAPAPQVATPGTPSTPTAPTQQVAQVATPTLLPTIVPGNPGRVPGMTVIKPGEVPPGSEDLYRFNDPQTGMWYACTIGESACRTAYGWESRIERDIELGRWPKDTTYASYQAGNGQPAAPALQNRTLSGYAGSLNNIPAVSPSNVSQAVPSAEPRIQGDWSTVNPIVAGPAKEASRFLPAGHTLEPISTYRANPSLAGSLHGQTMQVNGQQFSKATDFLIRDAQGRALANIRAPENFQVYREFMQNIKRFQDMQYPQLKDYGRWGGYFVAGVAQDLMHYDLGPSTLMAAGGWQNGLKTQYASYGAPGQVGQGMGTIASYQIIAQSASGQGTRVATAIVPAPSATTPRVAGAPVTSVQTGTTVVFDVASLESEAVANPVAGDETLAQDGDVIANPAVPAQPAPQQTSQPSILSSLGNTIAQFASYMPVLFGISPSQAQPVVTTGTSNTPSGPTTPAVPTSGSGATPPEGQTSEGGLGSGGSAGTSPIGTSGGEPTGAVSRGLSLATLSPFILIASLTPSAANAPTASPVSSTNTGSKKDPSGRHIYDFTSPLDPVTPPANPKPDPFPRDPRIKHGVGGPTGGDWLSKVESFLGGLLRGSGFRNTPSQPGRPSGGSPQTGLPPGNTGANLNPSLQQTQGLPPTLSFSADPQTVRMSSSTRIIWSSTNTNTCYLFGPQNKYIAQGSPNGSYQIATVATSSTYSMTCTSYSYGHNIYGTTTVMVIATSTSAR